MSFTLPLQKVQNLCEQPTGNSTVTSANPNESKPTIGDCEISDQRVAFYVRNEKWSLLFRKNVAASVRLES